MKIIHEREKCIGCGLCVSLCPDFWRMADDGKSQLLGSKENDKGNFELKAESVSCSQEAADNCPVQCIHVT